MKQCCRCGEFYPPDKWHFYAYHRSADGLTAACRFCIKSQADIHRAEPEVKKINQERASAWNKQNSMRRNIRLAERYNNDPDWRNRRVESNDRYRKSPKGKLVRKQIAAGRYERLNSIGKISLEEWRMLIELFDWKCAYCGILDDDPTIDHIIPLVKGGTGRIDNIVPACRKCNGSKGARDLSVFLGSRLPLFLEKHSMILNQIEVSIAV